jgi:hypothetical protein
MHYKERPIAPASLAEVDAYRIIAVSPHAPGQAARLTIARDNTSETREVTATYPLVRDSKIDPQVGDYLVTPVDPAHPEKGPIGSTLIVPGPEFEQKFGEPTGPSPVAPAILISPATASLGPGATQKFTAAVDAEPDQSVRWSIAPQVGSISPAGVYAAPATILNSPATGSGEVVVTATSVAVPEKTGKATVMLRPGPTAETGAAQPATQPWAGWTGKRRWTPPATPEPAPNPQPQPPPVTGEPK